MNRQEAITASVVLDMVCRPLAPASAEVGCNAGALYYTEASRLNQGFRTRRPVQSSEHLGLFAHLDATSLKAQRLVFLAALVCVLAAASPGADILADSAADWQASIANDGTVSQGEFGWEYGYISNFTGSDGIFYGWHRNSFYWENGSGINIFWPPTEVPPDIAWGQGGDSTGCRPPMTWSDGGYPWAGGDADKWAAVRRWTSDYPGAVDIAGTFGRYFDPNIISGWDVVFSVAVNANLPDSPVIYSKYIPWNDNTQYDYVIRNVPLKNGDSVNFIVSAASWNANKSYIRTTATIVAAPALPGDLDQDGCVNICDFAMFARKWLQGGCLPEGWCDGADQDGSGAVDMLDLGLLTGQWLECADNNPP